MKTMEKLTARFNRMNKGTGYHACFHPEDSHRGYYVLWIASPDGMSARYTFTTCADFRAWMDGVVLD